MSGFESDLRTLLERAAAAVEPERTRLRGVVGQVRRRRALRAAGAGIVGCAVVAGTLFGALSSPWKVERDAAGVAGQPAFESREGTHPVIATGTFEGKRWSLVVVEDPDAAHPEDEESDEPEILFTIEGPEPSSAAFETYRVWRGLSEPFHTTLHGGHELVMGMVSDSTASVTVDTDDGASVVAAVFDGIDGPVPGASYYLAFVPSGTTGAVVARDADDMVLAAAPLDGVPDAGGLSFGCDAEATQDGRRHEARGEGSEIVGRGTFEGRSWTVRVEERPDEAHPEDTESEAPEIVFEIEGSPGGSFETHGRWEVVDASLHAPFDGGEYVIGMASEDVASVAFERDGVAPATAALFEGRFPRPRTKYFLVFLPPGAAGDVVARDAAGAVVGRAHVDALAPRRSCDFQTRP